MTDMTTTIYPQIFDPMGHAHRKFSIVLYAYILNTSQKMSLTASTLISIATTRAFRLPELRKIPKIDSCN